jgi:hypothetical protein
LFNVFLPPVGLSLPVYCGGGANSTDRRKHVQSPKPDSFNLCKRSDIDDARRGLWNKATWLASNHQANRSNFVARYLMPLPCRASAGTVYADQPIGEKA